MKTIAKDGSRRGVYVRTAANIESNRHAKKAIKHGQGSGKLKPLSLTYKTWQQMKDRCSNPQNPGYHKYGGRGILVCPAWMNSFTEFWKDMGDRQSVEYSIERINNDGNYEPGNCRWATRIEQARNTRRNIIVTIEGRTQCLKDWAREFGISYGTVTSRIRIYGYSPIEALTRPLQWAAK